jgi:NRAMP (natural resistance-associated macrophage protein)-like metal ion transporter
MNATAKCSPPCPAPLASAPEVTPIINGQFNSKEKAEAMKVQFAQMVPLISNLVAMFLQHLCVKLGVASGRDLAQACRDHYSKPTVWFLWILAEIALVSTDHARREWLGGSELRFFEPGGR